MMGQPEFPNISNFEFIAANVTKLNNPNSILLKFRNYLGARLKKDNFVPDEI